MHGATIKNITMFSKSSLSSGSPTKSLYALRSSCACCVFHLVTIHFNNIIFGEEYNFKFLRIRIGLVVLMDSERDE